MVAVPYEETQIETTHELAALEREWDALADRTGAPPFLRPGWFRAWWVAFGSGSLELVAVRRDDRLVGLAPLRRSRGRVSSPTNYHTPEFSFLAADEEARGELARGVFDRGGRSVLVAYAPADETDAAALAAEAAARGWSALERIETAPFVDLGLGWDEYERTLSTNLRGDVRRRRRRLAEAGVVGVDVESGAETLEELLEEGFRVEGSGWKAEQGTAIASSAVTRRFYTDVARWAAAGGWLRLCFLRLNGRAIAFHYDLEADGVVYHLKGGYDAEYKHLSPSKVLHYALLERAFASGGRRYEFLGGNEPYKAQFSTGLRRLVILRAFAPTPAGRTEHVLFRHARPLAKRLRSLAHSRQG